MAIMTISPLQFHKDYVTRNVFSDHKGDMRNFRLEFGDFRGESHTIFKSFNARFNTIDTRLDGIDKRLDIFSRSFAEYKNNSFDQGSIIKEGIKDDSRIVFDHMKTLEEKIDGKDKILSDMIDQKLVGAKIDILNHFDDKFSTVKSELSGHFDGRFSIMKSELLDNYNQKHDEIIKIIKNK